MKFTRLVIVLLDMEILKMVFVAALWGATNPLIKKYSAGVDNCQSVLEKLLFLIKAPLYLLSFLGKQSIISLFIGF